MAKLKYFIKRFGTDIAGYGLILLGLLTGWLPGPGGIPLILAGLGLLSTHNHWAKKLLIFIKIQGVKFMDYVFPEHPWAKALHDILAVSLIFLAILVLSNKITSIYYALTFSLLVLAVVDFLYNRQRWKKFSKKIKR